MFGFLDKILNKINMNSTFPYSNIDYWVFVEIFEELSNTELYYITVFISP